MLKKIFKMLGLNGDAPVVEPKSYRLKRNTWFYEGTPPTINESQIHTPSILITGCMVLVLESETKDYLGFWICCNECKAYSEDRRHGKSVYYKKELFDNLGKTELK
jgi:hypothetical protein